MRRVEQLITQVRRATENVRVGTTDGLTDEEFIQYLNDGQEICESAIRKAHAKAFVKEKTWSATSAEQVTLPSDMWARQAVVTLEYSASGLTQDYRPLRKRTVRERFTRSGYPSQYCLFNNTLLIDAYPATGSFRLVYEYKLPRLDKRRARVASRTLSTLTLTALTLATTSPFTLADYDLYDYLSVVSESGVVNFSGVPYTGVSAGGVVTIRNSSFVGQTGETITVNDWVCLGQNSTPTSALSDECEKFLLVYAQRRILDRDSSADRETMTQDEQFMLSDIVESYAEVAEDQDEVPITNYDYFDESEFDC